MAADFRTGNVSVEAIIVHPGHRFGFEVQDEARKTVTTAP